MKSCWRDASGTREVELTPLAPGRYRVSVDGAEFELSAEPLPDGRVRLTGADGGTVAEVTPAGARRFVRLGTLEFVLEREAGPRRTTGPGHHGAGLEAPMPGVITKVLVVVGDEVKKGQPLVALEAMKMEHMVRAPRDGRVKRVSASPGTMVQSGAELVELEDVEAQV